MMCCGRGLRLQGMDRGTCSRVRSVARVRSIVMTVVGSDVDFCDMIVLE